MTIEIAPLTRILGYRLTGDLGGWTFYTSRRGRIVFFPQAPPLTPPTPRQQTQRNKMRAFGQYWSQCNAAQKTAWRTAAHKAGLAIDGTALATAWMMSPNPTWLAAIARVSGVELPP